MTIKEKPRWTEKAGPDSEPMKRSPEPRGASRLARNRGRTPETASGIGAGDGQKSEPEKVTRGNNPLGGENPSELDKEEPRWTEKDIDAEDIHAFSSMLQTVMRNRNFSGWYPFIKRIRDLESENAKQRAELAELRKKQKETVKRLRERQEGWREILKDDTTNWERHEKKEGSKGRPLNELVGVSINIDEAMILEYDSLVSIIENLEIWDRLMKINRDASQENIISELEAAETAKERLVAQEGKVAMITRVFRVKAVSAEKERE